LKTVSGLHLSGFTSRDFGRERSKFPAGSQIDVSIGWHCCFQPGLYFFNAGVGDRVGDDEVVLHRAIDIIAFRVAAANLGGQNGIVDVKPDIEINLRQQLTNALSGTAC
jgi:hypothetical protein